MSSETKSSRDDLLAKVGDIFYANGTYLVGMAELIKHLQTTRVTFYRHFASKEEMIVAYLQQRDAAVRDQLADVVGGRRGTAAALDVFSNLEQKTSAENFRGCAFFLAAIENPQSAKIQSAARSHKDFLKSFFLSLMQKPDEALAEQLLLLYEGALASSALRREAGAAATARSIAAHLMSDA
ncbi:MULTISPECIES: TetR/AcrR family transcriptional regulator [unclassified Rhizobium]|uniref:TetR/AcrR family transcriptional regulator n=1 Tax=unclassified Rhizobium TaxID=2613769 RepID=UPI001ADCF2E9|nr:MULTISPECIES: TetR/AcrR family transcriptional regulator [unclassified Rhizobium]MBO9123823.1 TetR/AcrR family transcriptional regulator [Rhizobium sp. 16-488-2b]MBO9174355.1 TetR/AcrR family transcriptional regulator [Rhizobium sp. 16-488-2a]